MRILSSLVIGIIGLGVGIWQSQDRHTLKDDANPAETLVDFINQGVSQIGKTLLKNAMTFLVIVMLIVASIKLSLGEHFTIGLPIIVISGVGLALLNMKLMTKISERGLRKVYAAINQNQDNTKREMSNISLTVGGFVMGALLIIVAILIKVLMMLIDTHVKGGGGVTSGLEVEMIMTALALTLGTTIFVVFIRIATSIYAKITDLAADSVGRTEYDLMEDDLRNPGSIPDMVGDLLSKSVAMGLLIYECILFCTVTCVVMSIITIDEFHMMSTQMIDRMMTQPVLILLIGSVISCGGIIIQRQLKANLSVSQMLMITYAALSLCVCGLEYTGHIYKNVTILVIIGSIMGIAITFNNQWAVSKNSVWVRKVVNAFSAGAVSGFLRGLLYAIAASMIPMIGVAGLISLTFGISGGFQNLLEGFHALSLSLIAMLSPIPLLISLGVQGAIADNIHGISEMVMADDEVKQRAKALDIDGTENLSLVRAFAIVGGMTSCLMLMLFYIKRMLVAISMHFAHNGIIEIKRINESHTLNVDTLPLPLKDLTIQKLIHILDLSILHPDVILGVIIGSLVIVVVCGALIMAIQSGVEQMTADIRYQMATKPGIWNGETLPDYHLIIESVTQKTITWVRFILIGTLCIPIIALITIELDGVLGMILGMITTGMIISLVANYAGGIWQMSKKVIEIEDPNYGTSSSHLSSVFVDGIGDVLKDTIAPSLYMIVKIISIIALIAGGIVLYL